MINLPEDKLKELLLQAGIINAETFSVIQIEANRKRQNLSDLLVSQGIVNREYLLVLIAQFLGVERVNLSIAKVDEAVLNLLPEDVARRRKVIVFGKEPDGRFKVAMDDPSDLETIDFLTLKLQGRIKPFLATEEDLNRGFILYGKKLTQDFKTVLEESVRESLKAKARGDKVGEEDLPIVAVVDNLLSYAISSRASDAHFEILDDSVLVRFRIDGILHEIIRMPKEIHPAVIARIKILASLRVDEHRAPQDGRFRYKLGGASVDIRVSILPTFYGEKVVMRLLTGSQKPLSLADLGVLETDVHVIEEATKKTYGMVLACGPTGSGKTTTLYSLLNMLNKPEVNIITIEDPIEYDMRYVNQVQVNNAAGITFASGLRSVLRQDPNIVMVGEIRDGETANIAVQAALTGHLVLSSIHTNDAPTSIPRFIDMGVPPFLISAVLNTVIAQRLVRKVHLNCIESYEPDASVIAAISRELTLAGVDPKSVKLPKTFYRGKGCSGCNYLGFVGRVGIYEVLNVTESIRKLIMGEEFSLDTLRNQAQKEGMMSMFEDGLRKVERGITTIEEVMRVIRE
ncbi:type II/IV secretion system protein [Candidatus Parcubacteria bacterium]|jgi:type IV pilus assembly protein PilB|nr:MAG: type II/IV secretion system protein [Candidatus Parcubacteria bacterium]